MEEILLLNIFVPDYLDVPYLRR